MKRTLYLLPLWLSLFFLFQCKTEPMVEPDPDPDPVEEPEPEFPLEVTDKEGTLDLPEGSGIEESDITVFSWADESEVAEGSFALDVPTEDAYTLIFAGDDNDDVYFADYFNPNTEEPEFTAESSALAVVMMSPWAADIAPEAIPDLLDEILTQPGFASLVAEVENLQAAGRPLNSPDNVALIGLLETLVKTDLGLIAQRNEGEVDVAFSGNEVTLTNTKSCSYGFGLYKDNQRVGNPGVLEGKQWLRLSLTDVLEYVFSEDGSQDASETITISNEGTYELRVTNGWFGNDDSDRADEADLAQEENVKALAISLFNIVFPSLKGLVSENCYGAVVTKVWNNFESGLSATDGFDNNVRLVSFMTSMMSGNADDYITIIESCGGLKTSNGWVRSFKGIMKFLDVTARINSAANGGKVAYDWYAAERSFNQCIQQTDGEASNCTFEITQANTSFTGINDCYVGSGAPYSSVSMSVDFSTPNGESASAVILDWYFFQCDGEEGNAGQLTLGPDATADGSATVTFCAQFGNCGASSLNVRVRSADGTLSQPKAIEIRRPAGANAPAPSDEPSALINPKTGV